MCVPEPVCSNGSEEMNPLLFCCMIYDNCTVTDNQPHASPLLYINEKKKRIHSPPNSEPYENMNENVQFRSRAVHSSGFFSAREPSSTP